MKTRIFVLICVILSTAAFSQITNDFTELAKRNRYLNSEIINQQTSMDLSVLDSPIDPDEYVVGPGDGFIVRVGVDPSATFNVFVLPEGELLIPTVGTVDLRNITLTEAKKRIIDTVRSKYPAANPDVTLFAVRKLKVTVSGHVDKPGMVIVTAADRVSDAIRFANLTPEDKIMEAEEPVVEEATAREVEIPVVVKKDPSERHITLTRRNGDVQKVDLQGYLIFGDKSRNPYLREGDVIYVPIYDKNLPTVEILGAVHEEGVKEFIEGDRVLDIVNLAHGFMYHADSSNLEIARFNPDHITTHRINLDLTKRNENGEYTDNIPLQVDDRIYVRYIPQYHRKNTAEIRGEIKFPGFYTIELGKTKLSDIVCQAGGITQYGSWNDAFIIRRMYEKSIDLEYERLIEVPLESMTEVEKEYFKYKSRERKGIVAVDFVKLFVEGDSTQDVLLRNDDYIEIPIRTKIVKVVGQVNRPGVVAFEPGKNVSYYVKKVGGYGWNANKYKIRVIRYDTGEWLHPRRSTIINMGDTIMVPGKQEYDYWSIFQEALSATVQIVSLIIVVNNAMSR